MRDLIKKISIAPSLKTKRKLILFLSDDWGCVRIRSTEDQKQLVDKGLNINSRFDQYDTLETNADVEALFEVLLKHKDHKGNHPVITPVTNVANPDFQRIEDNGFQEYYYESIAETYQRYPDSDQVLELVQKGIQEKIFVPKSHGREHVQINWWLKELQDESSFARKVFDNQFFFLGPEHMKSPRRNRGVGAAFDAWDQKDIETQEEIIHSGLNLFEELYGYRSNIFTPPAMFYNPSIEKKMVQEGIEWLDVGRFFKIPLLGGGERYQFNYLGRKKKSGLRLLVRNAVFESNMSESDGVDSCLFDIEQAFKGKQPAVISNHRAAFVGGIDPNNRTKGLKALNLLFKSILEKWPDAEFVSKID